MKLPWLVMLFTLGLYVAAVVAFLIADKFDYRQGANDMDKSLLTAAASALVIGFFVLRSIYQAIWLDSVYWFVVGVHALCLGVMVRVFMT